MVKSLKKLFSSFVAVTTIFSSVGFGALGFANVASAASAGDLIKASGAAVYYYGADGKRYVFPNEKTYFTWYSDFSSVKTITDAELAAIQIGGNVTYKPGVKMVKITTDPKVYVVDAGGTIRWVESEAIAAALYGSDWNTKIHDIPDAFFVNYTVGASVAAASYFDPAAATAAATSIDVDKNLSASQVGAQVTVKLASDTPAGVTVPNNSASVKLVKFALMGGASDATLNSLTVHRVGVGATGDFSNVYLYDGNGKRLTTGRSISSATNNATFSSLNVTIPANQTIYLYVYGDFSSPGTTGGQHAFEIADAASVVLTGSGTVSGTFPVRGNTFTVGTASAGRLDVELGIAPANPNVGAKGATISSFKLNANTNDILVEQITLYQAGTINNSDITNIKMYQGSTLVGTSDGVSSDGRIVIKLSPAYLVADGTTQNFTVKADLAGRAGRTVRTYVEYTTDVTATDQVYNAGAAVDIATNGSYDGTGGFTAGTTGCDTPGNSTCVVTQGGTLTRAFNGPPTQNVAKGKNNVQLFEFALTAENTVEIRNLAFSINTSSSGCMVDGSSGTNYFTNIKVLDSDTGLTVMGPTEMSTPSTATGSGTLTLSDTFNLTEGQTMNLAIAADLANTEDATDEFFGNGTCAYTVTLDAFGSTSVRIVDTGEFLDTSKIVPNDALTGNAQTVKSSNLTVSLAGTPSSQTVVKKQSGLAVAAFVFTAGAQSDVKVTDVTLECQGALATSGNAFSSTGAKADCDQRVTKLSLWNGNTMVGTPKAPDTTSGQAQITNMDLTVPAGSSLTLTAKADLASTASTTSPFDQFAVGVADSGIQAQDNDANTVTASIDTAVDNQADGASPSVVVTIRNSGVVTYNTDANPVSTIIVAGKDVWVPFARYKASAQFEAIDLDRIAVEAVSSSAGTTHNADNSIYTAVAVAVNGAVVGQDIFSAGTTGTKDIDLTNNKIAVPKDGSTVFELWAKISGVQASSSVSGATTGVHRSGMQPSLTLDNGVTTGDWSSAYYASTNIQATGKASGERVYASSTNVTAGNVMVTRKTKPVVTKQSLSSATLANTDMDLLKFNVAADSAGSVALKQVIFDLSFTGLTSVGNFRVRKGSSDVDLGNVAFTGNCGTGGAAVDLEAGSLGSASTSCLVAMSFTNEETVSSGGTTYTVHATIAGASSGDSLTFKFLQDSTNSVVTGYLLNSDAHGTFPSSAAIYHVDTGVAPSGNSSATGTFLWSDTSEVPHSDAAGASGGSRDWTNDVYVEDLSQTQVLSA